jgi:hypothetical protein
MPESHCTCSDHGFEFSLFRDSGCGHYSECSLYEVWFDLTLSVPLVRSTHLRATSRSVCLCPVLNSESYCVFYLLFPKDNDRSFSLLHVPRTTFFAKWRAVDQPQLINGCVCHLKKQVEVNKLCDFIATTFPTRFS